MLIALEIFLGLGVQVIAVDQIQISQPVAILTDLYLRLVLVMCLKFVQHHNLLYLSVEFHNVVDLQIANIELNDLHEDKTSSEAAIVYIPQVGKLPYFGSLIM
jgi:hypothetical protein